MLTYLVIGLCVVALANILAMLNQKKLFNIGESIVAVCVWPLVLPYLMIASLGRAVDFVKERKNKARS
jgi:hypothetical protein